jgi:hypothetical protein
MMLKAVPLVLLGAAFGSWSAMPAPAWAEENPAALAAALGGANAPATLQDGLKASEREGTPISAKFEIDGGKLSLSVYTMKGDTFTEVVADPSTGAIKEAETIKDADDLKAAAAQKAAMATAKVPLLTATETAVKANAGSRAVSIYPQLQDGSATAEVTLLQGSTFKKVTEKLD